MPLGCGSRSIGSLRDFRPSLRVTKGGGVAVKSYPVRSDVLLELIVTIRDRKLGCFTFLGDVSNLLI